MSCATTSTRGIETRIGVGGRDWSAVLRSLAPSSRDIYFTPEYHNLHQLNGDGEAFSSIAQEGSKTLIVAGMRSRIDETAESCNKSWDLETCNGYGGPVASPDADREFLAQAWEEWKGACRRAGMVAAFFRLHPLLNNALLLPADAEVRAERKTVFVDLSEGAGKPWRAACSQHRNMVNKGAREGVTVRWNEPADWDAFAPLYAEAMLRVNAPGRLRFSQQYFRNLRSLPGVELAAVRRGTSLASGAVFLSGELWGHYHLSARSADSPNYLMNCILQTAFERAAANGLQGMHLGGGKTAVPEDSLLKFKAASGGQLLDFCVALVVANRKAFDGLCERWKRQTGSSPSWLLGYRQPLSGPSGTNGEMTGCL